MFLTGVCSCCPTVCAEHSEAPRHRRWAFYSTIRKSQQWAKDIPLAAKPGGECREVSTELPAPMSDPQRGTHTFLYSPILAANTHWALLHNRHQARCQGIWTLQLILTQSFVHPLIHSFCRHYWALLNTTFWSCNNQQDRSYSWPHGLTV